ncbi:MAG: response regulator [Deltaproteobacteria bacterium]|nr:response regulator [Deltaproteobacteria bacterium]
MMKALALEFSSRWIQPLLDFAEERGISLNRILIGWGVELHQLRDETNWVSLRFCEALGDYLAGWVGPDVLAERVTRAAFSRRALGFLYPFLRTFGSPRMGYGGLPKIMAVLNKIDRVEVLSLKRGEGLIEFRPIRDEFIERSPIICRLRRAQIAAGPTLWGLPPARVEELECQLRGHGRCLYRVRWAERAGFYGLAAGIAAGLAAGLALGSGAVVVVSVVLAGGLAGRLWDQRRQVAELKRFNEEQTRALEDAATAAEQRFLELEKAKAQVDRQVEERTAELQRTTAELRQSLVRLEQLGRVKDEFVANVSHELRTPLTLILGPLEDLAAGRAKRHTPETLETMYRHALRLDGMINDLLELARLQAGQLRLMVGEVEVAALLGEVVERHRPLADRKGIALTLAAPAPLPICADARRLEFAFTNLLANALKFTPGGGAVGVLARSAGDEVAIEVADTGPGIPPEVQDQVFSRFARFDPPGAAGAAGAGIGLALVKELVELHGGRVGLASAVGHGATFTVSLPRSGPSTAALTAPAVDIPGPAAAEPRPVGDRLVAPGACAGVVATPAAAEDSDRAHPAGTPLVLVVEDHDDMRAYVGRVLRQRYRVAEAAHGAAALAFLATTRPDAILSDVMMPGMNGYELCRQVKAGPATRIVPVVLITARHDVRWAVEGFESGADDYLVKPFSSEELLARLDVHLRLRRFMDEYLQREKLASLGTLAAGLAHEVRNPVTAILAGLPRVRRELEQADVLPAAREMLGVAVDAAERINRLVGDVLDFGQPDREGPEPVDPHQGLEVALRLLSHRLPPGVEVRRRFAFAGRVPAHAASLTQVFVNLLDNALHAVGERGTIEVATAPDGDRGVTITVADSGPGVPPEIAARIFDPFFTTRGVGQGSGLGLHLSRRIVYNHGGRLELDAAPGAGACFRLWLPVTPEAKLDS